MYSLVIITHIPVFYKVRLYNEIAKHKKILVIFVANETVAKRSDDFLILDEARFKFEVLSSSELENRSLRKSVCKLNRILKINNYEKIIVSGWDLLEFWFVVFLNEKKKNHLALESTIFESSSGGVKGLIKKIFLSRISLVYSSGALHKKLLESLGFLGEVLITKGVGIIRKPEVKYKRKAVKNNRLIYVGRLSEEKNLDVIIRVVNKFPWLNLDLYGIGQKEEYLKSIAGSNIAFHGAIRNSELQEVFKESDFLILPSRSEPWGLVVEEALYFHLPVIISDRCGVVDLVDESAGYIIPIESFEKDFVCFLNEYDSTIHSSCVNLNEKDLKQVLLYK